MGPLPNLIYYASICTKNVIVAEYHDGDADLPEMACKCLQLLPPHHSRLSNTANGRMFACIIDDSSVYSAIADEALNRSQVMSFLEQLQSEFKSYVAATGLTYHRKWESHCLNATFDPVFRHLVSPLVGIPQKESDRISKEVLDRNKYAEPNADVEACLGRHADYDGYSQAMPCDASSGSRSPSVPLISKTNSSKYMLKMGKDAARDVCETSTNIKGNSFEKVKKMDIPRAVQRLGSLKNGKGQQVAQKQWCRCVKIVLTVDAVLCLILFCVWLGICKGFSCVREDSSS